MAKQSRKTVIDKMNHALLNFITPIGGIEFFRNKLHIGESISRIYAITKYPSTVDIGWLSRVSNIPRTVNCQIFQPVDNGALIENLSRSVTQNRGRAESTKDALTRQRAEKAADDAEDLMRQIDQNGETVGYMTNLIMAVAKDEKEFDRVCRKIESTVSFIHCKVRSLTNLQLQAYKALAPYHTTQKDIELIARRNIALSTYMGGFPFASSGYSDLGGSYLAKDALGGLIVIDPWKRGGDRTNTNWVIMGVAGVGKSTAIKHILLNEYMSGTRIILIDPEREYKYMTRQLGGDWIHAGGSGGRINPLQIRPVPQDEEEESDALYRNEGKGMGAMALHFKTFEIHIQLYMPDITPIQMALLKQALEELYGNFGITWDTDIAGMKATDFPVYSDLYALIVQKHTAAKGKDKEVYEYLKALIREIAEGADSFLWNGHTTLNPRSRFICIDTFDLQNASDRVKKTEYFNELTWCWEQMSNDRCERVLLVCDEAYLLIDPQVPQSLIFLRNVAKRARKYEAGLAIISHSVVDFLDPSVKMYGQALLDIPCYKVLMGTDGKNLSETADLYNLTDVEQDVLFSKKRGQAIFMIGSKRMLIHFDIPAYKFDYMGAAGGR